MEDLMSDIGTTPSLEPVTDEHFMDLISSASALRQQQSQEAAENALMDTNEAGDASLASLSNAKSLKCGFCGLEFTSYPELVEHRATHGGSRPYECHVCGKRFTQKAHLIIHRRTHTGEKPYACHICHKRFSQTSHLNSHKRVHSGDKPFLCSLCNMGFCRRQRLEAHLQQQHASTLQQVKGVQAASKNNSSNNGRGSVGAAVDGSSVSDGFHSVGDTAAALFTQMMGSADAKELLLSMGLSSMVSAAMATAQGHGQGDHGEGGEEQEDDDGAGDDDDDDGGGSPDQMSVYPGFDVDEDGEGKEEMGNAAEEENTAAHNDDDIDNGDDHGRASRSPTPNATSATPGSTTAPKSRRKPTVVRKTVKKEAAYAVEQSSHAPADAHTEENSDGSSISPEQFAQQAAIKAIMRMAGSDATRDEASDVSNDSGAMDAASISQLWLKQRFLAAAIAAAAAGKGSQVSPPFSTPTSHKRPPGGITSDPAALNHSLSALSRASSSSQLGGLIRHNSRVSLLNFTAADLLSHLLSRDDAYRCDFCCVVFQDAAMYHLHRSQHDKMDIRKCNLCGHLAHDRYDFSAHFMSTHK